MAHVTLTGNLRQFTGGIARARCRCGQRASAASPGWARNIPALAPHLEQGLAVAIDGQIYQDALLQQIGAG